MKRFELILDCDGVLADTLTAFVQAAHQCFAEAKAHDAIHNVRSWDTPLKYDTEHIDEWDIFTCLQKACHASLLSQDRTEELLKRYKIKLAQPQFWAEIQPMQDAKATLESMMSEAKTKGIDLELKVVTSPYKPLYGWDDIRRAWLTKHFGFTDDQIVITSGKQHVHGHAMIDDRPENLIAWLERNPTGCALLYIAQHNQNRPRFNETARMLNWNDIWATTSYLIEEFAKR